METKANLNSFRTRTYTPSVWLPDRGIPQKVVSKANIDAYPGTSRNSADPRWGKDATHPSEPDIVNVIMQRRFTAQLCCCIVIVSGWILGGYCASSVCEFSCASRLCGFFSPLGLSLFRLFTWPVLYPKAWKGGCQWKVGLEQCWDLIFGLYGCYIEDIHWEMQREMQLEFKPERGGDFFCFWRPLCTCMW